MADMERTGSDKIGQEAYIWRGGAGRERIGSGHVAGVERTGRGQGAERERRGSGQGADM